MIRILAVFFVCLISISAQDSGLQVSIGTEEVALGVEGLPWKLRVIAVTITNPDDSPQSLVVGTYYNNADHWNVTANLMSRDGKITPLSRLPDHILVTGNVGPVVVRIPAHGSWRALLNAENFEERIGNGSTNLAGIIGASGDQLQIVVHCGMNIFPNTNSWKGDLVSGWLKI
jgi:hypothetical protein